MMKPKIRKIDVEKIHALLSLLNEGTIEVGENYVYGCSPLLTPKGENILKGIALVKGELLYVCPKDAIKIINKNKTLREENNMLCKNIEDLYEQLREKNKRWWKFW